MIQFKHKNEEYKMHWSYPVQEEFKVIKRKNEIIFRDETIRYSVLVLYGTNDKVGQTVTYTTVAQCNPEDSFSRETGRVVSLKKLSNIAPKDLVKAAFTAYKNRTTK